MKRIITLAILSLLSHAAFAQNEAQALLEPFRAGAAPLTTFDYTLHYEVYNPETGLPSANDLRFAADLGRHFLYTESVIGGKAQSKFIYRAGPAEAFDVRMGGRFTPPADVAQLFARWLDQVAAPSIRPADIEAAVYEGQQQYGKLIGGEQVAVTALVPDPLGISLGRAGVKLLFNAAGVHIATLYSVGGKTELALYDAPKNPDSLPRYLNASLYRPTGRGALLIAKVRVTQLRLGAPQTPGLFAFSSLGPKAP